MTEAFVILLLLLLNGFFALAELSLVSSRKAKLALLAKKRVRGATSALRLADTPEDFLSAVQVGITTVGIFAGAFGGSAYAAEVARTIARVEFLAPYSNQIAYAAIVAVLTYLSVVVGELVPKQLALSAPERLACIVAPPMVGLVRLSRPIVQLLSFSSSILVRIFGLRPGAKHHVTEEEVGMVMEEAIKSGSIDETEEAIASRALRLADRPVSSIMTPRMDVLLIGIDDPREDILEALLHGTHSNFPVFRKRHDEVIGVLPLKESLRCIGREGLPRDDAEMRAQLERLMRPPVFIAATAPCTEALETMRREKTHFAIVVDEYGGLAGVLTNHDLLEALVGYIPSDKHEDEPIVTRGDGTLLVGGWVPIEDVAGRLEAEIEGVSHESVAALLIRKFGRIPSEGESAVEYGIKLEVVDRDGPRIDRVIASRVAPVPEESPEPAE